MRERLQPLLDAVLSAASAADAIIPFVPKPVAGKTWVLGAGKAAAAMAQAFERQFQGDCEGLVVTRDGHDVPCQNIQVVLAAHPSPDQRCIAGAQTLLEIARSAQPEDQIVFLLSGGASSLIACPPEGLELSDLQDVTHALLNGGANIGELNTVRRHLSQIAGGRLAQASGTNNIQTLVISDVTGDVLHDIGSGPTCADPTTVEDVWQVFQRFGFAPNARLRDFLASPEAITCKQVPGTVTLVATPQQALQAAEQVATQQGFQVLNLGAFIEADAIETAKVLAGIAHQIHTYQSPVARPAVLLSGGETTVNVRGQGRGGRNVEFAMGLAQAMAGQNWVAAAIDTDGVDGAEEIAGAWIDGQTLERARLQGVDYSEARRQNDGHGFFEALGDQIVTGPTLTNVNDFRVILIP